MVVYTVNKTDFYQGWKKMRTAKKITVEVPEELLKNAQAQTREGISETVRRGLQLLAATKSFQRLRNMKGKVRFSKTIDEIKHDRK